MQHIPQANFKLRGKRTYIHSASVLNHLLISKFIFNKIEFKKMTNRQVKFSKKKEDYVGIIWYQNFKNKIFINNTNIKIDQSEEYDEDIIAGYVDKKKRKITLNSLNISFTLSDIFVSLTKSLNIELFPSTKKWILADFEILDIDYFNQFNHENIKTLSVIREKFLEPHMSINKLFINDRAVAKTRYILI